MSDFFPEEIITEILKKLTPIAILTCLRVCKSWRSLISSPSFISAHRADKKPHLLIRKSLTSESEVRENYELYPTEVPIRSEQTRENYFLFHPQSLPNFELYIRTDPLYNFHVVGTVNGVICLVDDSSGLKGTIVLWNPLIRKWLYPPAPTYSWSPVSTLGFGFDPRKNALKILRIVWNSMPTISSKPPSTNAEVFTVGDSRWRSVELDPTLDLCMFTNSWAQCVVNGAAHWSAFKRGYGRDVLLSFQFEKEEFKIIDLPLPAKEYPLTTERVHVSKLGTLLSLVYYEEVLEEELQSCDIWAMKVYGDVSSWCKMVSVSWDGGWLKSVLWVRDDCGEILISTDDEELLTCYPGNQDAKLLADFRCKGDGYFADDFVESLFLVDHN